MQYLPIEQIYPVMSMAEPIKRSIYSIILAIGALTLLTLYPPVTSAQTDSQYVRSYYNSVVPRIMTNYKSLSTSFVTESDTLRSTDNFATGPQNYIGAEVSYKWASLGYNFGFNRENSSTNTDLRFATSYKPFRLQLNYTNLQNLNYYRVNGTDRQDTLFIARQHNIVLQNAGIRVDYVVNYKKFYAPAAISNAGQQLKSKGSIIISSGFVYQDFDLRGLSDSVKSLFLNRYNANHFRTTRTDLGIGYAYNWVISKRWGLYVADITNFGAQQIVTSQDDQHDHRFTVSFTNYIRAGLTYTWKNMFLGAYAYNATTTSRWSGFDYNNVYTSLQLHFGVVLGDPKRYWHKKHREAL